MATVIVETDEKGTEVEEEIERNLAMAGTTEENLHAPSSGVSAPKLGHSGMERAQKKVTEDQVEVLAKEYVEEFLAAVDASSGSGWNAVKNNDMEIHTRPCPTSSIDMCRGRVKIQKPAEEVWKRLVDSTHLRYVDKYYLSSDIVKRFDEYHTLVHYKYKMPFPLYPREFTVVEVNRPLDDRTWVAIACSVNALEEIPYDPKKIVRGAIYASGYLVTRDEAQPDSACWVTSVTHCDPGGSIPKSLVNSDAKSQPTVLLRIKKLIEENKKTYNSKK